MNSIITIKKIAGAGVYEATWTKEGEEGEMKTVARSEVQCIVEMGKKIQQIIDQSDASIREQITTDPVAQKQAIEQAVMIEDLMQGQWFRFDELSKKLKGKISDVAIRSGLETLSLFGLIQEKSLDHNNQFKFKITLTHAHRIGILEEKLQDLRKAMADIELQRTQLEMQSAQGMEVK